MIDESILAKIRKVQGYLKSDNINEAAVAAAKLTELLIKHNIDLSDIPSEQRKADPFVNVATDTESQRLLDWRVEMANAIAKANLCKLVISGSHLQWLGRESNVAVAQYIYETTANQLQAMADGLWYAIRAALAGSGANMMHGRTWKTDYLNGAATGVRMKLEEETLTMRAEYANVNALMLTNEHELRQYTNDQYSRLGNSGRSVRSGGNAYGAGVITGRNVSFRSGIGSGGSSAPRRIGRG